MLVNWKDIKLRVSKVFYIKNKDKNVTQDCYYTVSVV